MKQASNMKRPIWSGSGLYPLLHPHDAREVSLAVGPSCSLRPSDGERAAARARRAARRTHPAPRPSKCTAPGLHRSNHALLSSCAARRRGRREPHASSADSAGSMSISAPWPPRRRAPPHAPAVPLRGDPLLRPPSAPPRHPSAPTPPSSCISATSPQLWLLVIFR